MLEIKEGLRLRGHSSAVCGNEGDRMRYIAHCNNIALIIAEGMKIDNANSNTVTKDALARYLTLTAAEVVEG